MNNKIIIFGLGETAELAYEYFTHDSQYEVMAFVGDSKYIKTQYLCGLPVYDIENIENFFSPNEYGAFAAAASGHLNRDRKKLYEKLKNKGYTAVSYISSKASVWHNVSIGENCFIMPNNVLEPYTKVGNNVVMWSGNHLGHRSVISDHSFITSHVVICGCSEIGKFSFLGVNSSIADFVKVADNNFIGMGVNINKNTKSDSFFANQPSRSTGISAKSYFEVEE